MDEHLRLCKSVAYIMNIAFCYECPYCLQKQKVYPNGKIALNFICKKSHKLIRRFSFVNKVLLNAFMFDLPRKFSLYEIWIPAFCELKSSVDAKKLTKNTAAAEKQTTLFDMEGIDGRTEDKTSPGRAVEYEDLLEKFDEVLVWRH